MDLAEDITGALGDGTLGQIQRPNCRELREERKSRKSLAARAGQRLGKDRHGINK